MLACNCMLTIINTMSPHSEQPLISTEKTPPLKQTFYDGAGLWF